MADNVQTVSVTIPTVAYKGPHDTDASMFRTAASNLDNGYILGGGNLTTTVVALLHLTCDALGDTGAPESTTLLRKASESLILGRNLEGRVAEAVAGLLRSAATSLEDAGDTGARVMEYPLEPR